MQGGVGAIKIAVLIDKEMKAEIGGEISGWSERTPSLVDKENRCWIINSPTDT